MEILGVISGHPLCSGQRRGLGRALGGTALSGFGQVLEHAPHRLDMAGGRSAFLDGDRIVAVADIARVPRLQLENVLQ